MKPVEQLSWTSLLAFAAIACAAPAAAAPDGSLSEAAIAKQTRAAWTDWKAGMKSGGWTGMQPRIAQCFRLVAARKSQEHAVYCAVLDHLTLLDTMNFPERLRPPYFATDTVFARLDKAVEQTTPRPDRKAFESRLLSTMDETIHKMK